jgi:hypothetical protein
MNDRTSIFSCKASTKSSQGQRKEDTPTWLLQCCLSSKRRLQGGAHHNTLCATKGSMSCQIILNNNFKAGEVGVADSCTVRSATQATKFSLSKDTDWFSRDAAKLPAVRYSNMEETKPKHIVNTDETSVYFDMPRNYTVDVQKCKRKGCPYA